MNCAAITETLLESELFGHEKGAFTGAVAQKKGKIELANGGTLFLDEIGEFAIALQAKLLRVLQERELERVGGTRPMKIDVRFVAATNRGLLQAVEAGTFRRDLYHRLNVVSITLPALRERTEDISLLADYFVAKASRKCRLRPKPISPEAQACLLSYDWPGNVRELEHAIERALVLGSSDKILPEDLPAEVFESAPGEPSSSNFQSVVKDQKKQVVQKAMQQSGGNYIEAAKVLGIHPNSLLRLIRNLNLKGSFADPPQPGRHASEPDREGARIKAAFEGGFCVYLVVILSDRAIGSRIISPNVGARLHVRLGFHGCSPFLFGLVFASVSLAIH